MNIRKMQILIPIALLVCIFACDTEGESDDDDELTDDDAKGDDDTTDDDDLHPLGRVYEKTPDDTGPCRR